MFAGMNNSVAFTTHLDGETLALVEKLAIARGISSDRFAAEAIQRAAESEADFLAFVQEGIDDIEAGRFIPHADVMAELDEMIARHKAR